MPEEVLTKRGSEKLFRSLLSATLAAGWLMPNRRAAREILSRVEQKLGAAPDFDPSRIDRPFVFALSESGEYYFLPKIVESLQKLAPHAPIRSVFMPSSQVEVSLAGGEVDLAIGPLFELKNSSFCRQRLHYISVVCLVREDYPIQTRRLTLKQYLGLRHVLVRTSGRTNMVLDRALGPAGANRNIVLMASHSISLPEMIEQTDLAATINRPLAEYFVRSGAKVKILEMPPEIPPIAIDQVWHRRFHDDARNKWLRALVKTFVRA